jgi:Trimethylamine:corrinoid methyltransferase
MQAGHEKTLTALLPILAGANMIYGPGMLESGLTMSLGQVVADADFVRMFKTVLAGIPVNEETLALDVIHSVGIKGQYLGEEHTFRLFKQLQSVPKIMDRNDRSTWTSNGSKDMATRADEEARRILETYKPQILNEDKLAKIHQIVMDAEKELVVKEK